jgi:hypothetical protein
MYTSLLPEQGTIKMFSRFSELGSLIACLYPSLLYSFGDLSFKVYHISSKFFLHFAKSEFYNLNLMQTTHAFLSAAARHSEKAHV